MNSMSCSVETADSHINDFYARLSRVNHSCINNADHIDIKKHCVKHLTASRHIAEGEEVTISYATRIEFKAAEWPP
ncbi:SET domain-containing protein-lysine N-methyltransferase [archaeon]|nr:MAG: SET domain-containing protein-lysine N-methyltransferase [archaeon]